jgi:hypothetical protein
MVKQSFWIPMIDTSNFKIIDKEWWSFLVTENVNKSIEITEELK